MSKQTWPEFEPSSEEQLKRLDLIEHEPPEMASFSAFSELLDGCFVLDRNVEIHRVCLPLPRKFTRASSKKGTVHMLRTTQEIMSLKEYKRQYQRACGQMISSEEPAKWLCTIEERDQSALEVAELLKKYKN
jgi:hypothetical protein